MTAAKSTGTASAKGKSAKAVPPKSAPAKGASAKAKPAKAAPAKAVPAKPPAAKIPPVKAIPVTIAAKPPAAKAMSVKAAPAKSTGAGRKGRADSGSEANLHKRVDSERIALHIAAFEKSGGRVEKLGITRVLQKVDEVAATAPAQAAKPAGRRR